MGIIDKVTALLPKRKERQDVAPNRAAALALRNDFDQWLERVFDDTWTRTGSGHFGFAPSAEIRETDQELIVKLDVPGLDRDDLDIAITPDALIIRGAKREVKEDQRKDSYVAEARYGEFSRTIPLPSGVDVDGADARVKNGVVIVKFPKVTTRSGSRRIPISA